MKKVLFCLLVASASLTVFSQKLVEIYKKDVVRLVPDTQYAQGNDWETVFKTYYDTIYGSPMGNRKSLKLMPDGSVIVNHRYRNFYTRFSPDGRFEKEFGITNSKGQRFKKTDYIEGIINNNTFFTGLDNMGNMICFDFDGNYKKTLKLDYMTKQMIPLPNNKIAVVGWVIWSTKFRDFVSIVDYETNQEKVIWEYFTERPGYETGKRRMFNYSYKYKSGGIVSCTTMPFSRMTGLSSPPSIACIGNKLIVAVPTTGEILIYSLEGKLMSKEKIGWAANSVSVEEQREIQQKAIEKYKSSQSLWGPADERKDALEYMIKEMETDLKNISEPIPIPVFSTIIQDSDNNLLFFEYPKEENANKFNVWVYETSGKFLSKSSFVCDEYDLEISPSKMVFYNGYIYSLQLLKNAKGVPLRLVRFKLTI